MSLSDQSLSRPCPFFHIIGVQLGPLAKLLQPQLLAFLLILSPAFLISGCSAVKLGYNNAPELSYWWLDSYLDLNDTQSLTVRADLATLQAWHRRSELPIFVSTLEKLQRLAPSNLTPAQVCGLYAELKPRLQAILDQAEPALAALAPTLSPEQIDHLARQLDVRSEKWREKWLAGSSAERSARRVTQMMERAEMLYGRLEDPQLAVLRANVAASVFDADTSYRESLRRHQDTLQTLRQIQTGTLSELLARERIHALFERSINSPDAAYRQQQEKIVQENCQTFAALHDSTTPAQRLKAIETLKSYADDARALIAPGR